MDIDLDARAPGAPPRRGALYLVVALAVGAAFGFAVARARPAAPPATVGAAVPSAPASASEAPGLPTELRDRMVARVRQYNQGEPDTVESADVQVMTALRDNLVRFDGDRRFPRGDYRLQVICLGEGQVWALFRIGDDETYLDIDCHDDHVLVAQLLLTARSDGRRTITLVSDSPLGVAVGLQVLHRS